MAQSVYLETSVISYLAALPSRDVVALAHQQLTQTWWARRDRFELLISQAVWTEAAAGDPAAAARRLALVAGLRMLDVTEPALELAEGLVRGGALPPGALIDAIHLATAAVHGIDFLLTWNCKHIANVVVRARFEQSCRTLGIQPPLICTPEELSE
jgi:predicted nucleic acid-binding protein